MSYQTEQKSFTPYKEGVLDKDGVMQVVKYRYISETKIEVIDFNNKRFTCEDKYLKRK
jgi:hypothetical protein